MAEINKNVVHHLAKLCRIRCSEAQEEALVQDMSKIIGYVERLAELDTEGVPPCNHVIEEMVNVEREDETGETLPTKTFLDNAPAHVGGMIRVPPVIKNRVT